MRSALALLGKSIRPELQWPDEPIIGMATSGRDFEDHSDFMGSILFLNSLHRDPAAPNYSGIGRDYDLRAVGKNVTENSDFKSNPATMKTAPLFTAGASIEWTSNLETAESLVAGGQTELAFWVRVMRELEVGSDVPWELVAEVLTTIPEAIWDAGPEAVAAVIREIEAKLALQNALNHAEVEVVRSYAQRHGIGGNNPPEQIDEVTEVPIDLQIVWEPFADLKEEVEKDTPDTGRIEVAISKLTALLAFCGKWLGEMLNAGAKEYVKSLAKAAGTATAIWVASLNSQINAVLTAAKDWLLALLG